jgi:hypothetical protein
LNLGLVALLARWILQQPAAVWWPALVHGHCGGLVQVHTDRRLHDTVGVYQNLTNLETDDSLEV